MTHVPTLPRNGVVAAALLLAPIASLRADDAVASTNAPPAASVTNDVCEVVSWTSWSTGV